jgi:ABC-2 type transport system permease protein
MATALAFVKRDISLALSYRLSFLLQFLGLFLTLATFYFLSTLVGGAMAGPLEIYGGEYFPFVLIGLAFSTYMMLGLQTFSQRIREGQMMGTLEIMLLSPTRLSIILLASSIWAYVFGSVRVLIIFILAAIVFTTSFAQANLLAAAVILLLSVISFASIGIISAAFIIVLKKGDPIAWAFGGLSTLLSGVFYPVAVLPDWLQGFSALLPLTYALNAMRLAVLQGYSVYELRFDILALLGFSAVFLPLAILSFRFAVKRAKTEGSLVQY